LSRGRL